MSSNDLLNGKRVVILGLARQGTAAAKFLANAGADVVASDMRPEDQLGDALNDLKRDQVRNRRGAGPPAEKETVSSADPNRLPTELYPHSNALRSRLLYDEV